MLATPREAETTINREGTWHDLLSPDPRAARMAGARGRRRRTRDWTAGRRDRPGGAVSHGVPGGPQTRGLLGPARLKGARRVGRGRTHHLPGRGGDRHALPLDRHVLQNAP